MKAYELLAEPRHWTKGAYSRLGTDGVANVMVGNMWCVVGAIWRCYGRVPYQWPSGYLHLGELVKKRFGHSSLTNWNDSSLTTHADVVSVLKELDL